ncbi:MAG: hypothetical protein PVJ64_00475 [Gemmatimonadales bacterium]|jgi:hypothetical protein
MRQLASPITDIRAELSLERQELCTPRAIMRSVFGIVPGEWACPSCGTVYEEHDYPRSWCSGCRRPLGRRCIQPGCNELVQPVDHGDGTWSEPTPICSRCVGNQERVKRGDICRRVLPEHAQALAKDYWTKPHRRELDAALRRWVETWQEPEWRPWVVTYGDTGSGKTVSLVRTAAGVYFGRQFVSSLYYVTEEAFLRACSLEWHDEPSRRVIEWTHTAGLLVLDECGAKTELAKLTDAQAREYPRLLKARSDGQRPTLIGTNRQPPLLEWLEPHVRRLESRLAECAWVVRCSGVDLRQQSAAPPCPACDGTGNVYVQTHDDTPGVLEPCRTCSVQR